MFEVCDMTGEEAEAMVFVKAFKALKKKQRYMVLREILKDAKLRRDMGDAVLIESRREEDEREFEEFVEEERGRRGR